MGGALTILIFDLSDVGQTSDVNLWPNVKTKVKFTGEWTVDYVNELHSVRVLPDEILYTGKIIPCSLYQLVDATSGKVSILSQFLSFILAVIS